MSATAARYLGTVYLFYSISHLSPTACANRYTAPRYPVPAASRAPFHGCCGEVNAMSNAANAGARLEGSVVATVRAVGREAGQIMDACSSCRAIAAKLGITIVGP